MIARTDRSIPIVDAAVRAEIIKQYIDQLEAMGNPIVAEEALTRQTMESAAIILEAAFPG